MCPLLLFLLPATVHCPQLLDMIAPPYTGEFVQLLLPLIENKAITDTLRTSDGKDPVSEFISEYVYS